MFLVSLLAFLIIFSFFDQFSYLQETEADGIQWLRSQPSSLSPAALLKVCWSSPSSTSSSWPA